MIHCAPGCLRSIVVNKFRNCDVSANGPQSPSPARRGNFGASFTMDYDYEAMAIPSLGNYISELEYGAREEIVIMVTILVVILVLMLVGALPSWPHSRDWGYYP